MQSLPMPCALPLGHLSYIDSRPNALAYPASVTMLRPVSHIGTAMNAPQDQAKSAANSGDSIEEHLSSTPDEAGPHDVPDDEVIEKTLPTVPVSKSGSDSPQAR